MITLPINSALPAIRAALASSNGLVLQAPPGAGKTTGIPPSLLDEPWLAGRSVMMLEPRRLATRGAAYRMAELRDERVGDTVGYRMRGESRVGPRTRIEVVTEGILTRRLQRDPTLDGFGAIIFDEFHERSLDSDLGLALTLRTREMLRPDLRIIVMSATLDGVAAARLLGDAPIVTSEGRAFPVGTHYAPPRAGTRLEVAVASTISEALRRNPGDVLVFLPGAGEIRRVESILGERDLGGATVLPLFGALSQDAQDRAIRPDPNGRRKVVLSTSIAETSLTIEGIGIVIDCGLSRVPRFSPRSGMTRLETVRVSKASADQRRGRAGRTASGVCYRMWPEYENAHLLASSPPEIASADLAPLALDLAGAGVESPNELRWIDAPSPAAFNQAVELLRELDAIDDTGSLTSHGREMCELPLHPRLAHMLRRASSRSATALACDIAALLSERDIFRFPAGQPNVDIGLRLEALRAAGETFPPPPGAEVDRDALRRARAEARRLRLQVGTPAAPSQRSTDEIGVLLALAYPDRVAQRRTGERARYLLRNGTGAELASGQAAPPFIVATELDDHRPESRVFLAAEITLAEIRETFADQIIVEDAVEFDDASSSVAARRRERLGAIVLRDVSMHDPDPELIRGAIVAAIRRRGIAALPWSDASTRFRDRLAFMAANDADWPAVSDDELAGRLDDWLGPALTGVTRWADLERIDLAAALATLIDWRQRRELDELAPTHIETPSGSRFPVDYSDPTAPALAVRIQAAFGMTESPRILRGRVPLTMRLLSPANRPVQVTRDLAGFWRSSYLDVRKDMRGRYPKHDWPEDPTTGGRRKH